jgi:hypothetical protein
MEDRTNPIELTIFLAELRCAQVVTASWSGELSDSAKIGRPPTTGPRFRSAA